MKHMDITRFLGGRISKVPFLVHYGIILLSILRPVVLQSCSGTENLTENGTITSPGYPSNYRSYSLCKWSISVPEGFVAILRFERFTVESCSNCGCDNLNVYDGPDENSPVLARLCGSNLPSPVYSTQNRMFVKFNTDGSVVYAGFSGTVLKGEVLTQFIESDNGTIQSPNYPQNYEPQKRYVWNITVPENYQIFLVFLDFETQFSDGCVNDFVEVRDGQDLSSPLLGKLCGTNVEKYMRTSSNKLIIAFQSDGSQEAKGFFAEFRKVEICHTTIVETSGNLNTPNYPNNYGPVERCTWNIIAPEDHHVLLRFLTFNIADSGSCSKDYVKIYNGNDTTASLLGKFCGSNVPNVSKSTSNQITVEFHSDSSDEAQGFSARFETDYCGEEYHSDSGTFHSPNYPDAYQSHEMCTWKVTVSEGYRVALRFDSFQLESSYRCNADAVKVFDGLNATSPELDKLCGVQNSKRKVYSTANTLSVRFVTDASYSKSGFSATYIKATIPVTTGDSAVTGTPCHQEIKSDSGTVNSPNYPQIYSPGVDCVWNIEVPEGMIVRLEFQSFDLESDITCNFDFVEIKDGSQRLGKYCGSDDPQPHWSTSNKMSVRFVSDSSFENPGFSATFTKVDYKEQLISGVNTGTLTSPNYPNKYESAQKRIWQISVPSGNKILLKFLSFELEYSQNCTDDFVMIHDGENTESSLLGKFCGTSPPTDIRSSANKLTVVFATDTSEELNGFSAKFEKEVICGDDSCGNGGTCKRIRGVNTCSCKHGYQGNTCAEKVLCSNDTCEHGGLCIQNRTDGIFQCICSHGYEGEVCHERILCGNETCRNGGYCTHRGKDGILLCVCEPGFEGLFCEKEIAAKSAGTVVSIVVPIVILLAIASAVILFFLIRRRLKQQVTQPYDNMKKEETFFDKDETYDS